ncbi:retrovirus-related pol polyprotein from transposon TNT 1-94 [Tanacetum coccineum]
MILPDLTWLTVYQSSIWKGSPLFLLVKREKKESFSSHNWFQRSLQIGIYFRWIMGPSINRKKYILVIVDDFSRYTWVYFLCSKDETSEIIKKFISQAQLKYKAKVCKIRTDNGIIDPTLFTRRHGEDILLVQVYVDDIIFGSTNPDFSKCFAILMKNNFEMSMMGELKFFLGLQVHQSPRGIFISQSQYAIDLLKKHGLDECVSMSTPMATKRLDADLQGTPTDQTTYRRMIGGLMYLTASL